MEGLRELNSAFTSPHHPRVVANGPSTLDRIREVGSVWSGPVTILSQNPWQKALRGRLLKADLVPEPAPDLDKNELLTANLRIFKEAVANALLDAK